MRTLDCVVIKLEGGSDWDLGVLDLPDTEEEERREEARRRREGREERDRKPLHRRSHSNFLQTLQRNTHTLHTQTPKTAYSSLRVLKFCSKY